MLIQMDGRFCQAAAEEEDGVGDGVAVNSSAGGDGGSVGGSGLLAITVWPAPSSGRLSKARQAAIDCGRSAGRTIIPASRPASSAGLKPGGASVASVS